MPATRRCFKACIRAFDSNVLSQSEKKCVVDCLSKYRESERYLAEKVHKLMVQHAAQSPQISALYDGNLGKA